MTPFEITIPAIEKKFDIFNAQFFENRLPHVQFIISNSKCHLGRYSSRWDEMRPKITISTYYKVSEEDVENTLIHEMIHLYEDKVLHVQPSHTRTFKTKANEIYNLSNGKYNITRLSSRKGYELSEEGQMKADRVKLNGKKPIIVLIKEINKYGEEYMWLMRVSDKLYTSIFFDNEPLNQYVSKFIVMGFIYDKPKDWIRQTKLCTKTLGGYKLPYTEFISKHKKDIMPHLTLKHNRYNREYKIED